MKNNKFYLPMAANSIECESGTALAGIVILTIFWYERLERKSSK